MNNLRAKNKQEQSAYENEVNLLFFKITSLSFSNIVTI